MINAQDIEKLAGLARLSISEEEKEELTKNMGSILAYIDAIKKATEANKKANTEEIYGVRNVMREDSEPHQSGMYSEKILNEAPRREGDYVKVKKIL
ncbi:MAG: Asp-tRNA(Asn)/Glu-tRNA(Gln) amidotransferase subunit GatC [Patescibacteria group bacterium]|nr:Asp-tRNA(Asn)/Glu-tRNA(Gln) amidotransferase subunit GatC [Patescibacteria group bacterium]